MLKLLIPLLLFNTVSSQPVDYQIKKANDSDPVLTNCFWNSSLGERGIMNQAEDSIIDKCKIYQNDTLNVVQLDTRCNYYETFGRYTATLAIKSSDEVFINKVLKTGRFSRRDALDGGINGYFSLKEGKDGWYYFYGYLMDIIIDFPCDKSFLTSGRTFIDIYVDNVGESFIPDDSCFVYDNVCPEISNIFADGKKTLEYKTSYSVKLTEEEILDGFVAKDTFDFNPTIVLDSHDYSNYLFNHELALDTTLIEYIISSLKVYSVDKNGNRSEPFIVNIKEYDDIAPSIDGPSKIYKSSQKIFTTEDIINLYDVKDISKYELEYKDGDSDGKNKYLDNASTKGDYVFRLLATDLHKNIGTKTIDISVNDTIAPVVYYDDTVLVDSNIMLELVDFVNLLKISNEVDNNSTNQYSIIEDNYTNNASVGGTYDYSVKIRSSTGESKTKKFKVKVNVVNFEFEDNGSTSSDDSEKKPNESKNDILSKIKDWFWKYILKPIAKLFGYKEKQ